MVISLNNVYKLIKDNGYKSAIVYEDEIQENSKPFESIKKTSSDDLIKRLKELENIISGKFTLLLGKGTNGEQKRNMAEVKTEFYQTVIETEPVNMNATDIYESSSTINKKVDELVNKRLKELEDKKKIEDLENKVNELDTMGGKINYFLNGFINFLGDSMSRMNNQPMQGFDPNNKMEVETLEENLATLVNYMGEENIEKFANKIKSGKADAVKPIIINFLNT